MKLSGKRIFITGGAGFIGSHLTERFIEDNKIIIYDTLHRNALQHTSFKGNKNLTFIEGDVLDVKNLHKSIKDIDLVIHLASIAGVPTVIEHPNKTLKINLIGAYNVLEECRINNVSDFVDFSTSEVYGPVNYRTPESGVNTIGPKERPRCVYALAKLASEHLSYSYFKEYGLKSRSVRPFNVYGPRQMGEGAVNSFVRKAVKNEPLTVYNEGNQIRSWCYVTDMVDAIQSILLNDNTIGESFNIGNPQATSSALDTALRIVKLANSSSKIEFKKADFHDVEVRVPNIDKAKRVFGFEPKVPFDEGLLKTINWVKSIEKN